MEEIEKKGVRPDGYKATDEEVAQQEEMIERKGLNDVAVAENATAGSTCEKSSQVGNAAKMRDALKYLRDASREFCHLILNSKYNAIFDKYKHPEVAKISDAIANAGLILAEPPRNCDLLRNSQEALVAIHNDRGYVQNPIDERRLTVDWLLAEAKGDAQ